MGGGGAAQLLSSSVAGLLCGVVDVYDFIVVRFYG